MAKRSAAMSGTDKRSFPRYQLGHFASRVLGNEASRGVPADQVMLRGGSRADPIDEHDGQRA
ncbi:MAG: hypothetical protein ABII76_26250, partial [Pseudomonadota bacterium]